MHKRKKQDKQDIESPTVESEAPSQTNSNDFIFPFLAEVVLAYLFWCIFTDHIPTFWFGPMSILRATDYGEEFYYLVAYASPLLLLSTKIRKFFQSSTLANMLPLIGIPSYLMNTIFTRTLLVCLGTLIGIPLHFSRFWGSSEIRKRSVWAHLIALVLLVSSRFAFSTLYPLWLNSFTMFFGLFAGIICSIFVVKDNNPENPKEEVSKKDHVTNLKFGVGFGSLIFLSHWLLSTHGVISRWIDLDPFVYGIGMIVSMILGLILSGNNSIVRSEWWYFIAVISGPAILSPVIGKEIAIYFGFIVTMYLMSVWHVIVGDMAKHTNMVYTLGIAFLVYVLSNAAIIWSIAYCFVPFGGPPMRERAGQLFCISLVLVGLGYNKSTTDASSPKKISDSPQFKYPPQTVITVLLIVLLLCTVPGVMKRGMSWNNHAGYDGMEKDHVRAMIWAIRFGYDNLGWPNVVQVAEKIKSLKVNVIGLVETDTTRPFNGNRDIVEYLEEHLHMYSDFGPSTMNETWGCALLSFFPIVRSEREVLSSPEGENACLIDATLNVDGLLVDVIVVHDGNTEHELDRALQAQHMAKRILAKKLMNRKMIWLGYLTEKPGGPNYSRLIKSGLVDVSPGEDRYCLYLFHMGMAPSGFKRIDVAQISDTEIQTADFFA